MTILTRCISLACVVMLCAVVVAPSFADDRTPPAATTDNVTSARGEAVVFDRTPYVVNHSDHPDAILYDNGPLSTGATSKSGVAAPAGSTWSEVQNPLNDTTQSNTTSGFSGGITTTTRFRLTDNFTVPAGTTWTLDSVATFGYQTGSTPGTSPFIAVNMQVWRGGRPGDPGAVVVGGDTTTNRLTTSVWNTTYRIFNTKYPPPGSAPGTTRPVFKNVANMGGVVLSPGTYWLDWQTQVTASAAHFAPSVTLVGRRGDAAWNGRQWIGTLWQDALDTGNPAAAPDSIQDFPFVLYGRGPAGATAYCRTNVNLRFPDNNPVGNRDTLVISGIPAGQVVRSIAVRLDSVVHTWVGDLNMTLTHGSTTRTLMNRPGPGTLGSSGDNFVGTVLVDSARARIDSIVAAGAPPSGPPYTGFFRPDSGGAPVIVPSSLAPFLGSNPNGNWILFVSDNAAGDTGKVVTWCLLLEVGPPTSVDPISQTVPERFTLEQNYPNPFNPTTTIKFGLPVAANVTVKIHNVLGQEVATLVDGLQNAGTFQAIWNGRNSAGAPVASGMYFYSLVAKSADSKTTFTNIKKMLLLK